VSKPISKVAVRCPHCGGEQQEPELAKSTFCRTCSQYFAITPAALASAKTVGPANKSVVPRFGASSVSRESGAPAISSRQPEAEGAGAGLFQKFESLFGKPRVRVAQCFECTSNQEVSGTSHSTTCRACGAYIDLQDYKINGSFSRNIKTRGSVYLGPKGDLSSSKIICTDAVIHGKMRGNMLCYGKVVIKFQGRLSGSLETGALTIEKGSEIVCSRPIKAEAVTIAGKMSGQIQSDSHVTIHKTGSLDGAVVATGFNVERGGCFQGELTISPRGTPVEGLIGADATEGFPGGKPAKPVSNLDAFIAGEHNPALG
jgi:cytoskeletal protein CcmA (bactofilin family)